MSLHREVKLGAIYALAAFITWGMFPLYFKLLSTIPTLEILCHRAIWATVWMAAWLYYKKNSWYQIKQALSSAPIIFALFSSALMIAINWGVFIWAVSAGRVLETSLGYFISPLVNVLLGWVFLKERLQAAQKLAVTLAMLGALNLALQHGEFPWVACCLAISFGFYGLLRKTTPIDALPGLFIEMLLLSPLALGYLVFLYIGNKSHFLITSINTDFLLISAGLITLLPLLWFGNAARRLRLTTLGFFQYITPSISFLMSVLLFKELFTTTHLITFSCIWVGLAAFSYDNVRKFRAQETALATTSARN